MTAGDRGRTDRHKCPGCDELVPRSQLACRRDWARLPADLRAEVSAAYRDGPMSGRHVAALGDALDWYRNNPPATQQPAPSRDRQPGESMAEWAVRLGLRPGIQGQPLDAIGDGDDVDPRFT